MAGIYIHIPFCAKACHYCNFHFSTSLKYRSELVDAICKELTICKSQYDTQTINTIYFGGGTPSILSTTELGQILTTVYKHFKVKSSPEITLEANPEDLTLDKIRALSKLKINRLSIGIQSFSDRDLKQMNRAHSAEQAISCLEFSKLYFDNISVDLIFGIPKSTNSHWRKNIATALKYDIPHLSCYALTVEPKTVLEMQIKKGVYPSLSDELASTHFKILVDELSATELQHYEVCSFGKPGLFSEHNMNYWFGGAYLGVGPSAHSFDGEKRSWNCSNNIKYIKQINSGKRPVSSEILTKENRINEYVMTGLRTMWGISLSKIEDEFGGNFKKRILDSAAVHFKNDNLVLKDDQIKVSAKGQFLCDGIASDLFII